MTSPAIFAIMQVLESLTPSMQDQVVHHLQEYIEELNDELKWDELFSKNQSGLIIAAQKAKKEIVEGKSVPMNYDQL